MRIDDGSVTAVGVVHRLLAPRSSIATWYNFRRDSSSSAILQLNGGGTQNLSSGEPLSAGIGRIVVAAMAMLIVTGHVVAADLPTPSPPAPSAPNWAVKAVYLFVDLTDLHDRGELRRRRWLHSEFQRKHHTRRHQFQIPGAS
jgi:hypothetical protein